MKTKPPLTITGLLQWSKDVTRELYSRFSDGSLKYPHVKTQADLVTLSHPKYIGSIAHVQDDNNPYIGVQNADSTKTVWKKVTLEKAT